MHELIPAALGLSRSNALAHDCIPGQFADRDPHGESGHAQPGRPTQHCTEYAGKLATGHRLGRGDVNRPGELRILQRQVDQPHHVAPVNPGHVLAPGSERAAEHEAEQWSHLRQRSASLVEHRGDAEHHHAHTMLLSPQSLLLPLHGQVGQKVVARLGGLIERAVTAVAVIPHGRGIDQHVWPAVSSFDGLHHLIRAVDTTVNKQLLVRGRPAFVDDAGPGQVNHRVATVD